MLVFGNLRETNINKTLSVSGVYLMNIDIDIKTLFRVFTL